MDWVQQNKLLQRMVIDAHNHFWQYNAAKHSWINEAMDVLKKDFMPGDLKPLLQTSLVNGCVAVQADESEEENFFLLKLADENDFIKGVVGWIDMMDESMDEKLQKYFQQKKMKGFRYVLQDKKDRDLMLSPVFTNNIRHLANANFTYDILILNDQLIFANEMVKKFPKQKFIIDHLAKPAIKSQEIQQWQKQITAIAKNENVYCKLSGMVTEADWQNHTYNDFLPYMQTVLNAFGSSRLLYGSDWPVCLLAAPYYKVYEVTKQFISTLSAREQENIMGNNAMAFYNL
jgi:L-fuconolactonase